jgi:cyclin-A
MQVDQFVYITDHTYTRDEVLATEEHVLAVLDFELTQPTAKTFLRRFIQVKNPAAPPAECLVGIPV